MTLTLILATCVFFYALVKYLNRTEAPKIPGIPEIPGVPLFGNLIQLGENHALKCMEWAKTYGPVFQVRMGEKRIVIANSYKSVRELWINNQSALVSRPTFHTFHSVVSTSQGFTIGTSPWDESCKNRRKAAATALNRPAVQSYMPIIDLESTTSILDLLTASKDGTVDVDPTPYFQRYALNTSLTLNYGFRIAGGSEDALLKEIVEVEAAISRFRSTSNNWQDYIPLLRWLPSKKDVAARSYRGRRDRYLGSLLERLKEEIREGRDRPCITGNILKDPEAKLNNEELKSICLTMVSAGLDTVPANLLQGIGYLSTPHGQEIQETAYEAIMAQYPDGNAWNYCVLEEKVDYVTALVKEILRYYTVIPICLPRVSVKDVVYEGAVIPRGTLFYMNAYAADYDATHFASPNIFNPERYLQPEHRSAGTPHYAYGAGSRMCAGSHLANRELYAAFVRLILAFRILPPRDDKWRIVEDAMENNGCTTALVAEPRAFRCRFVEREEGGVAGLVDEAKGV
ncbi:hypothetical protein RUND412_004799 [Rhizina undulata]